MKKVIFFTEGEGIQPVRFVKAYRKKGLFRKEKVELSYFVHELDIDDETTERIITFIKKSRPGAKVDCETISTFEDTMYKYRYYVVCKFVASGGFYGFDTGMTSYNERVWTTEIEGAQLHYENTSAEENATRIAKETGERVTLTTVYITNVNPLSEQKFIITCKSRKSGRERFYARAEGTRLRLVKTSDAAAKFSYNLSIGMFDMLNAKNKSFLYSVMPYIPNVHCSELDRMREEKKIPVAIMMTTKLKWMGRERKGKD